MSPSPKSQVMFAVHSHESVIVFVFLSFILLRYGHFVEYMNMHAMNMWLTDAATVVVGRIGLCTHGVTTMLGCHCGPGATQLK